MKEKFLNFLKAHKIWSVLICIAILYIGYKIVGALTAGQVSVKYTLSNVEKDTLMTTVSGSGQVSASNQVDVKSRAGGDIISVSIKNGQSVKDGDLLVQLDSADAANAVRDAELNLESAQLSLQKLLAPSKESAIKSAQNSLEQAKNNLEKLKVSQQIDYQNALDTVQKLQLSQGTDYKTVQANLVKAQNDLPKQYEDAFGNISDAYLDLPDVISRLDDILNSNEIGSAVPSLGTAYKNTSALSNSLKVKDRTKIELAQKSAENDYKDARSKFDVAFASYKTTNRYADHDKIISILTETIDATKSISQAVKSEINYIDYWVDLSNDENPDVYTVVSDYQTELDTYSTKINAHLSTLLSIQQKLNAAATTLVEAQDNVAAAEQNNPLELTQAENNVKKLEQSNPLDLDAAENSVQEKQLALDDLWSGPDELDIRSQQLTISQKENALADTQKKFSDYSVRAPFDGIIAKTEMHKGDQISSGTLVATMITDQSIADISLNEVDVAKVQVGQKATLTFDAVEDLTISGSVVEIDTLGTVTQGVVTYNVKILFDTQDERLKPGMSLSGNIITELKQGVLIVPNSAIKTQGDTSYIEKFDHAIPADQASSYDTTDLPEQKPVETGLTNDTSTEIISGLNEGDQVVTKTTTGSTAASTTASPSLFGGGSGGIRLPR